jgi:flagellar protein FliS
MYSLNTSTNQKRLNQYLVKEIMEATPQQLLLKIYDFALLNVQRKNIEKTNAAIQELINSLNFNDEKACEISTGLFRLYQYCQDQTRKKNFEIVYKILSGLRDSWKSAFNM